MAGLKTAGPCALITGANGGIGRAMCDAFIRAGYSVVATDKDREGGGHHASYIQCDLEQLARDADVRKRFREGVLEMAGEQSLRVLVNNAAIQLLGSAETITVRDWDSSLAVNLSAPFMLTQLFLSELEAATGSVVNVASVHGVATKPGFVAYATSKAALIGLTRALAVDLGNRVRVNAILPAATDTPMLLAGFAGKPEGLQQLADVHPMGRIATAEEVASIAVFLASAQASFVTGSSWTVDGGVLARLHDPA